MKKTWKKLTAILLAFVMMIPAMAVQAQTKEMPKQPLHVEMPKKIYLTKEPTGVKMCSIGYVSGAKKVTVKVKGSAISVEKVGHTADTSYIMAKVKKTGTAYIYTTVNGKKTYKTRVIVKKYANPISSMKIGRTRISGTKFNKGTTYKLPYKKFANKKCGVKIKLNKGWRVNFAEYHQNGWMMGEPIEGAVPIKGGPGFSIIFTVEHEKTKMFETIYVEFV